MQPRRIAVHSMHAPQNVGIHEFYQRLTVEQVKLMRPSGEPGRVGWYRPAELKAGFLRAVRSIGIRRSIRIQKSSHPGGCELFWSFARVHLVGVPTSHFTAPSVPSTPPE